MENKTVTMSVTANLSKPVSITANLSQPTSMTANLTLPKTLKTTVVSKDYNLLENKPSIEQVVLEGDKTFEELGLSSIDNSDLMELLTL